MPHSGQSWCYCSGPGIRWIQQQNSIKKRHPGYRSDISNFGALRQTGNTREAARELVTFEEDRIYNSQSNLLQLNAGLQLRNTGRRLSRLALNETFWMFFLSHCSNLDGWDSNKKIQKLQLMWKQYNEMVCVDCWARCARARLCVSKCLLRCKDASCLLGMTFLSGSDWKRFQVLLIVFCKTLWQRFNYLFNLELELRTSSPEHSFWTFD